MCKQMEGIWAAAGWQQDTIGLLCIAHSGLHPSRINSIMHACRLDSLMRLEKA